MSFENLECGANADLEINLLTLPKVNFASSQNGVSIIKKLSLKNLSDCIIENVVVTVECTPGIIRAKSWNIDRIAVGNECILSNLETPLDTTLLSGLNEAEVGSLRLTVHLGENKIIEENRSIELLARDEWGGLGDMAHLLAAFVSPNDAAVAAILKDASQLLEAAGHNSSINGYQSQDPSRVWMLAGAIWSAATGLGLSYAVPPASFEQRGQKVRNPERIRSEGLATCLDSSLFLAACFEAAGLNSVVLFSEGHAWAGVWLANKDFGSITEHDVMTVRKAVDAREFVMMETTLLTKRPTVGFEEAVAQGREHIAERNEHTFQAAVDISRARAARIRPLATHRIDEPKNDPETPASPAALPKNPEWGRFPSDLNDETPNTPQDRISRWQRKLLDLSLRNRLLNFRDSKQSLPFICSMVSELEDQLAGGKKFKVFPLKDEDPLGGRDLIAKQETQLLDDVAKDAFLKGQITVPLTRKETEKRLTELYRKAKSDMQEGGTNTLFLAAGFLRWKKSEGDTRSYRAPLLLIPVKISRRSAQSDFLIENHEDDVRFNATLLEFLKRDFDLKIPELEGELPKDTSGFDLPCIFEIMRRKVRDVVGFEVVEDLALSTFSFAKFLMWKDLVDRTDSLRECAVVKHLVDSPTESFLSAEAERLPEAEDVDRRIAPRDLFTPLPADSSQLAAVLAAQDGHNFVLIGPPGTGKSQTIANIISQCLAVGKTVLFVAEKSAALDVVHRRLAANGLGNAVLELHSNKSDRKSVIDQLSRSWERASAASQTEWIKITDDLTLTRSQLNNYVSALHKKGTQGVSVFQAIGYTSKEQPFRLMFDNKDAHDTASYERLRCLSQEIGRCYEIVANYPELQLVQTDSWSFAWQEKLVQQAESLKAATRELFSSVALLTKLTGLNPNECVGPDHLSKLYIIASISPVGEDVSWALSRDLNQLTRDADSLTKLLSNYRIAIKSLSASYPMDRLQAIPLDKLDTDWRLAQTKIWPFSIFSKSSVRKLLQTYAITGKSEPSHDISALIDAKNYREDVEKHALSEFPLYAGVDTDDSLMSSWVSEAINVRASLSQLSRYVENNDVWESASFQLASKSTGELRDAISTFNACYKDWIALVADFEETTKSSPTQMTLKDLSASLENTLANKSHIEDWTRWVKIRDQAKVSGLEPLVTSLESGELIDPAEDAFLSAYASWWLPRAIDADDALRSFSHWGHEDAIKHFKELDTKAMEMSAAQVLHRIQHGLPAKDAVPRKSELGILRHQTSLQRPSMPIRTLISEMPETFNKLAPCVLMSPLSVAQYLPAGQAAFDVVIFDEASQITTWDAVGAIARGRQAIIVGDPKQLPPTNFFGRADNDEDDIPEEDRDLSSILDEVAAAGIPTQQLNWHYRSRDESLIAFSNWHYYGGRLITFPSPATASKAVQLHQIDGVYGRGQGRTNESEARAIVNMAVSKMTEWLRVPAERRLTLGVITFNVEQQGLILDLFDEERRAKPDLEWFFEDAREEPVIVKNLENIQGDERDVMLFSITFGHDHAGKLSMAFGALNSDGGEKRLNVAVTRARHELHVFSSLRADEIDLTRTKAIGVKHLKGFLDYAARGAIALPAQDDGSVGCVENMFEAAIKMAIEAKGWELRPQIGVSGFRIDFGVIHPDHAGVYLAGIECDGATYHSSATARDRDKVRQAVLENLGWKIFRIWSTDWFKNAQAVVERIHEMLLAHLEDDRAKRNSQPKESLSDDFSDMVSLINTGMSIAEPDDNRPAIKPEFPENTDLNEAVNEEESETSQRQEPMIAKGFGNKPSETSSLNTDALSALNPEQFYEATYILILEELIAQIALNEGPLPIALLGRRVSSLHGWQRTGRRIAEQIHLALANVEVHIEDDIEFIWAKGSFTDRWVFRHGLDRGVRDISRSEIAGLYDQHESVLDQSNDPILELARLAGISRLSADARAYLDACINWRNMSNSL